MKLLSIATILALFTGLRSAAVTVSDGKLLEASVDVDTPRTGIVWPGSASRMRGVRSGQMTNGERMQRYVDRPQQSLGQSAESS
jgi:hypothetical protein